MVVNVHEAKTTLSRLIARVEDGEEVIIARNGKPAVKIVPALSQKETSGSRVLGGLRGKLKLPPDWEKRWKEMDGEIAQLFHAPLTSSRK